MAIRISEGLRGVADEVRDRMRRREDGVEIAARDAVIALQLLWVKIVQDSVAAPSSPEWWVPGTGRGTIGQQRKTVHAPAKRTSIIAQGGEIGWRAWGRFDRSLQRYRLRSDEFKRQVKEITAEIYREALAYRSYR